MVLNQRCTAKRAAARASAPIGAAMLALAAWTSAAAAPKAPEIRSAHAHPLAVRGGTLMLPLVARRLEGGWPATLDLTLADGRVLRGQVAWVHPADRSAQRLWAQSSPGRAVRAIQSGDELVDPPLPPPFGAYLLAELPADGDRALRLGDQTLQPTWIDAPPLAPAEQGRLELAQGPALPDPTSPFEYWRWALLAERANRQAPDPREYGEIGALVARHHADLWRWGLARLAQQSRGVAARCRELLTQTCRDGEVEFAAWVNDPAELASLLSILLDQRRDEKALVEDGLQWADARPSLLWWPEQETGDQVRVAIVNLGFEQVVARMTWPGADEVPIAAVLKPGALTRVTVDRPPRPESRIIGLAPPAAPAPQWLHVEAGAQVIRIPFGPRARAATPPGVTVGPLRPELTLADAWAQRQHLVDQASATLATVRRMHRRWEVFFECRRLPASAEAEAATSAALTLEQRRSAAEVRGLEAVTLFVGPEQPGDSRGRAGAATVILSIPEGGPFRFFTGHDGGGLEVHRRSYGDRWFCRVVMPDHWLSMDEDSPTLFAFARTHGDSEAMETGPSAVTAWQAEPSRLAIDLGAWGDAPPAR